MNLLCAWILEYVFTHWLGVGENKKSWRAGCAKMGHRRRVDALRGKEDWQWHYR